MMGNIDFSQAPRNPPRCVDCGKISRLQLSDVSYPTQEDMHGQPAWTCECGAFSLCRSGTIIPRSRPASRETRALRYAAYMARIQWEERFSRETGKSKWAAKKASARLAAENGISTDLKWITSRRMVEAKDFFESHKVGVSKEPSKAA